MSRRDEKFGGGSAVPVAGAEERSDEAPATGASPSGAVPEPEVLAKPSRRQFTAEYRLRILEEADRCTGRGEVGRLLRPSIVARGPLPGDGSPGPSPPGR